MVFNHNVGKIIANHFHPPGQGVLPNIFLIDNLGISREMNVITASSNRWNLSGTHFAQIGQGITPPTREDYNIETPFTNAPENARVASGVATYLNGTGITNVATQIQPMGGNGTITEVTEELIMRDFGGTDRNFVISRTLVDPAVNFLINEQVNIDQETTL